MEAREFKWLNGHPGFSVLQDSRYILLSFSFDSNLFKSSYATLTVASRKSLKTDLIQSHIGNRVISECGVIVHFILNKIFKENIRRDKILRW